MCENCSPLTSGRLIAHFSSEAGPLKRLHIRGTYAHAPCRSAALETATESTIRHPLARSQRPRTIFRGKVARDFTPAITIPSEALPCVLSSCFPRICTVASQAPANNTVVPVGHSAPAESPPTVERSIPFAGIRGFQPSAFYQSSVSIRPFSAVGNFHTLLLQVLDREQSNVRYVATFPRGPFVGDIFCTF